MKKWKVELKVEGMKETRVINAESYHDVPYRVAESMNITDYVICDWKEDKNINKYELIDNRLHDDDVKKAVKAHNWEYVVNSIVDFFSEKDSGKNGKIWEIVTKLYLNGYKGNSCIVSPKGKVDVTYKGNKIEIKSNCGQLDMNTLFKNNYICYTMDNEKDIYHPENGKIAEPSEWFNMLDDIGLVRNNKKSSSGVRATAIQSYKNSKKKTDALRVALSHYITVAEWAEMV